MSPRKKSAKTIAYEHRVMDSVLSRSVSKNYTDAKKEWEYRGEVIDYEKQIGECGACGHAIRYMYILHNKKTKKRLGVGSECIGNFLSIVPTKAHLKKDVERAWREKAYKILSAGEMQVRKVKTAMTKAIMDAVPARSRATFLEDGRRGILKREAPALHKLYETYMKDEQQIRIIYLKLNHFGRAKDLSEEGFALLRPLAKKYGVNLDNTAIKAYINYEGKHPGHHIPPSGGR